MTSRATPRVRHVDVTTWAEPGVRGRRPAQCFREGRSALHRLGVGGRTRRLCVGSSGGGRRCPHSRLIFTCYPKNGSISSIAVDITVGRFWARPFAGSAPTPKRRCLHANVVRFLFLFFSSRQGRFEGRRRSPSASIATWSYVRPFLSS